MRLPEELIELIGHYALLSENRKTLSSLARCSSTLYRIMTPLIYQTVKMKDNQTYTHFLSIHEYHANANQDRRPCPLQNVRYLRIAHFPAPRICSEIERVAIKYGTIFPEAITIEFMLPSCHSILWGPLHVLQNSIPPSGTKYQAAISQARSWTHIARPKEICFHLNDYAIFERRWNTFFQTLCAPWKESLEIVNIHGLEYRLRPCLPGALHRIFMDVQNVPYRPGTGLMVSLSAAGRKVDVETWVKVLLDLILNGQVTNQNAQDKLSKYILSSSWEFHCPGARSEEILETKALLCEKLKMICSHPASIPSVSFITDVAIPCTLCGDHAPLTIPRKEALPA